MALIEQGVLEKKMFEIVDDDVRTDAGACVYYKLTHEPLAQVSQNKYFFFELFPFEYFAISLYSILQF